MDDGSSSDSSGDDDDADMMMMIKIESKETDSDLHQQVILFGKSS